MNGFTFSRLPGLSRSLLALFATSAVFTAGCANMATTAIGSSSMDTTTIGGNIHGGNQPVAGATVNLWFAGQGPSTPPTIAATTTSASDGSGSFSFIQGGSGANHFTCPTLTDPLVYVVATGGNTLNNGDTSVNNTAAVFAAPFEACSKFATNPMFVNLTEVTTVATMAALQQYFTPNASASGTVAETFSSDGTGLSKTAMTNAFATVSNMVNLTTGTAITSATINPSTIAGFGHAGTTVTATPESAKINVLANILSSCINNASASATACTTLFNNATPGDPTTSARPSGTIFSTATDTLQAIYYILTNPGNSGTVHLTNLYNLSSAAGAPYQPVLSAAPSDWTVAISYSSTSTCNSLPGHLIHSAQDLAIDTFGNVWLANNETSGNLSALSPIGAPLTCVAVGTGANTGVTIDSLSPSGTISNIWLADSGSSAVYRYNPGGITFDTFPTAHPAQAIAADGIGNIYFTSPVDTSLYEIPGGVTSVGAVTPVSLSATIGSAPAHVLVDSNNAIWTTSGSTFITRTVVSSPSNGTGASSIQLTSPGPTNGIAVTANSGSGPSTKNFVYVSADGANNVLDQFQGFGTSYAASSSWPSFAGSTPGEVAADGAQNVWTINSGANAVVAVGANLQPISPSGGFQKSADYLGSGRALAIDQSGDVWIGLDGVNAVTEIVGAAVPVYQPYATGLKTGFFQTIP